MAAIRLPAGAVGGMPDSVASGWIGLILVSGLLSGCGGPARQEVPEPNRALNARESCDGLSSAEAYVPHDRLVPSGELLPRMPSLREFYTELLRAMGEPPMFCGPVDSEIVRLGVLTWTGAPAIVRVSHADGRTDVTIVKLEAPTWNLPPGEVLEQRSHLVDSGAWKSVETALRAADVWNLDTARDVDKTNVDGATWILEIRQGGSYQIVSWA